MRLSLLIVLAFLFLNHLLAYIEGVIEYLYATSLCCYPLYLSKPYKGTVVGRLGKGVFVLYAPAVYLLVANGYNGVVRLHMRHKVGCHYKLRPAKGRKPCCCLVEQLNELLASQRGCLVVVKFKLLSSALAYYDGFFSHLDRFASNGLYALA